MQLALKKYERIVHVELLFSLGVNFIQIYNIQIQILKHGHYYFLI